MLHSKRETIVTKKHLHPSNMHMSHIPPPYIGVQTSPCSSDIVELFFFPTKKQQKSSPMEDHFSLIRVFPKTGVPQDG